MPLSSPHHTPMPSDTTPLLAIDCKDLTFSHNTGLPPVLEHVTLELQRGDRCLLVGANGGTLSGLRH